MFLSKTATYGTLTLELQRQPKVIMLYVYKLAMDLRGYADFGTYCHGPVGKFHVSYKSFEHLCRLKALPVLFEFF